MLASGLAILGVDPVECRYDPDRNRGPRAKADACPSLMRMWRWMICFGPLNARGGRHTHQRARKVNVLLHQKGGLHPDVFQRMVQRLGRRRRLISLHGSGTNYGPSSRKRQKTATNQSGCVEFCCQHFLLGWRLLARGCLCFQSRSLVRTGPLQHRPLWQIPRPASTTGQSGRLHIANKDKLVYNRLAPRQKNRVNVWKRC